MEQTEQMQFIALSSCIRCVFLVHTCWNKAYSLEQDCGTFDKVSRCGIMLSLYCDNILGESNANNRELWND